MSLLWYNPALIEHADPWTVPAKKPSPSPSPGVHLVEAQPHHAASSARFYSGPNAAADTDTLVPFPVPVPSPPAYRSPSWSWATTDTPIAHESNLELLSPTGDLASHETVRSSCPLATLLIASATPSDPANAFARLRAAHLTLDAYLLPWRASRSLRAAGNARTAFDSAASARTAPQDLLLLPLMATLKDALQTRTWGVHSLIVTPCASDEWNACFRRVGYHAAYAHEKAPWKAGGGGGGEEGCVSVGEMVGKVFEVEGVEMRVVLV